MSNIRYKKFQITNFITLSNQNLSFALQEREQSIKDQIKAVKMEHAAKGLARSGATIKRVKNICINNIKEHGIAVETEYRRVINQAFFTGQSLAKKLEDSISEQFKQMMTISSKHLSETAIFAGKPELSVRLIEDIDAEIRKVKEHTKIIILTAFAEKNRSFIRSIIPTAWELITKIFRFGL